MVFFKYKNMITHWHIFFIMWPSGSGKWTLISNIKKSIWENIHFPLSYKTRAKRKSETHGIDAFFISHEDFDLGIEKNEFLEYAILYDGAEKYGTKYDDILKNGIEKGKKVIKEIDILGLKRLQKERPEIRDFYTTIFLKLDPKTIIQRIEARWDFMDSNELKRRILTAKEENQQASELCDYMIDASLPPEKVLSEVLTIIQK